VKIKPNSTFHVALFKRNKFLTMSLIDRFKDSSRRENIFSSSKGNQNVKIGIVYVHTRKNCKKHGALLVQ